MGRGPEHLLNNLVWVRVCFGLDGPAVRLDGPVGGWGVETSATCRWEIGSVDAHASQAAWSNSELGFVVLLERVVLHSVAVGLSQECLQLSLPEQVKQQNWPSPHCSDLQQAML